MRNRKQGLYLDNAATSHPKPSMVYETVTKYLRDIGASAGRSGYSLALEADRAVYRVREQAASFLGVEDSGRIVFTFNATHGLNLALRGLLKPGDGVVTTSMEHNSVLRPLHELQQSGISVTHVQGTRDGFVTASDIENAFTGSTRAVIVNHVSNVNGIIQPVNEIGRVVREHNAVFIVDAAQSLGHIPVHAENACIDILAGSGHKGLLGPPGTGIMYVAPGIHLDPLISGGTGSRSESLQQPSIYPDFLESGTMNVPGIAGLGAGMAYLQNKGMEAIQQQAREQTMYLREELGTLNRITLYNPPNNEQMVPVISFIIEDMDNSDVATILDDSYGIMVRSGLHCAPMAHRTIGSFPRGTVRVSPGAFTTMDDLEYFVSALQDLVKSS